MRNSGPWDPWLPVVKNSRLFAQRGHSACTAHGAPPLRMARHESPFPQPPLSANPRPARRAILRSPSAGRPVTIAPGWVRADCPSRWGGGWHLLLPDPLVEVPLLLLRELRLLVLLVVPGPERRGRVGPGGLGRPAVAGARVLLRAVVLHPLLGVGEHRVGHVHLLEHGLAVRVLVRMELQRLQFERLLDLGRAGVAPDPEGGVVLLGVRHQGCRWGWASAGVINRVPLNTPHLCWRQRPEVEEPLPPCPRVLSSARACTRAHPCGRSGQVGGGLSPRMLLSCNTSVGPTLEQQRHGFCFLGLEGAFSHSANYNIVHPGNTPENHPPTEACMIHSKQHRGCRIQGAGTRGYRWWKTADFSQRAHSAHCTPGYPE